MGQSLMVTYLQLLDKGDPDYAAGPRGDRPAHDRRFDATGNLGQAVSTELEDSEPPARARRLADRAGPPDRAQRRL